MSFLFFLRSFFFSFFVLFFLFLFFSICLEVGQREREREIRERRGLTKHLLLHAYRSELFYGQSVLEATLGVQVNLN